MNEEQLIATLQACYFGDRGAFNKILKEYKQLQQELTKYKERCESLSKQLQNISNGFLKYNWKEATQEQTYNQLKSLYESILQDKEKE